MGVDEKEYSSTFMLEEAAKLVYGGESRTETAIRFLIENKDIIPSLVTLRIIGKTALSQRTADVLVSVGVFDLDEGGYHLSETAEGIVDKYIELTGIDVNRSDG